jgi:DNA-binding CsgD family transcriptional regulator
VTVVVGVDGAGRTHRLRQLTGPDAVWVDPGADLAAQLERAARDGLVVVVDDAHRLPGEVARSLAAAVRRGAAVVMARRPTIAGPELAELDEVVAARGRVEQLAPLGVDEVATLVAGLGGGADPAQVHAASAGLPALAHACAQAPAGGPAPALLARVQRRLAVLAPLPAGLARLLALRLELGDVVLAEAAGVDADAVAGALRELRDEGMLGPGDEMVPAVAEAVLAELSAAERRRVHDAVARALVATGADPLRAAGQLRAARAATPAAAPWYAAAGERLRLTDPAAALGWFDDAVEAGADPATVAAGRAEAGALLGLAVDVTRTGEGAGRLALVEGAVEAHQGRAARSAAALAGSAPPGPVLAVPALVATGDLARARALAPDPADPPALRRLAEALVVAATDPMAAVPLCIEAAEAAERNPPALVLPDSPHALGALVAVTAGDAPSAEHLLERALAAGVGGPVAVARHRLLLAWVRLRMGRFDTAAAELAGPAPSLPGRERLLHAALAAGLARRSGDVARLREAWTGVEQALARQAVDLLAVEPVEELAVAATRLRHGARVAPVLDALDEIVAGLGRPPAWVVAVGWVRLQVAVAGEDAAATNVAAAALAAAGPAGARAAAQQAAAARWAEVLAGAVDADGVVAAAADLAAADLPWEASRLVGQAAIRTTDPAAARRLLERARELSSAEVATGEARAGDAQQRGGLSEREVEVATMVLAGGTYREIGSRLFISPKTVEHHVARIRTKLGATTRAEFVAALREILETPDA